MGRNRERARGLLFNNFSFLSNLQAAPAIKGRGGPSSASAGAVRVDCQGTWEPRPAPPRHDHVLSVCTHTHRETNLKMNPGTEIPLDQPDSQVYYLWSADSSLCSGTELRKQPAGPLRRMAQQRQTSGSDAGAQVHALLLARSSEAASSPLQPFLLRGRPVRRTALPGSWGDAGGKQEK